MCAVMEQFGQNVKGTFSFFDWMIIDGYIQPLTMEFRRAEALSHLGILYKDFTAHFHSVTEQIKQRAEGMARDLGRSLIYLDSPKISKEETAKKCLAAQPTEDGLICVIKTLEMCKSARVCGDGSGKLTIKTSNTKCPHDYLYYQDKEYGFMFIRIQTWFPFNVRVYINGREAMKSAFEKNGITFQCYDNSFTHISDVDKARELADKFDAAKLRCHLDGMVCAIKVSVVAFLHFHIIKTVHNINHFHTVIISQTVKWEILEIDFRAAKTSFLGVKACLASQNVRLYSGFFAAQDVLPWKYWNGLARGGTR